MNFAIICPMQEELDSLLTKIDSYSKKTYGLISGYEFETKKGHCFAFIGKIGKANIGFDIGNLINNYKFDKLILIGVSGSLKEEIVPLNVIIANKVCYYDADATSTGSGEYKLGQIPGSSLYFEADKELLEDVNKLNTTLTIHRGLIISGDSFATKKNMTDELLKHFDNPLGVDMESASVGQIASRLNIPFFIIRGVSDNIIDDNKLQEKIYEEYLPLSAKRASSILLHLLNEDYISEE